MMVYHGSYMEINKPDIIHSRQNVDLGKGFYTTPLWQQARSWCNKFKSLHKKGVISKYNLDEQAFNEVNIMQFETYSEAWLDFILACRRGKDIFNYDIVIGGVADDKVFNTIELYFDNLIDKQEAIKRLRYEKPNLQICFRTQDVIDRFLFFEGSEEV